MRKIRLWMLFILVFSLVLAGSGSHVMASKERPTIGVITLVLTGSYFQVKIGEAAKAAGEALGAEVTLHAPESFGDYEGQVAIVEDLIAKKVDAIVLEAAHPMALVPAVEAAYKAGIPVISVDNKVESDKIVTYIGTDNVKGAYLAGKYIAKKLGGKGKIALLLGEVGTPNETYRTDGFKKAIAEYPGLKIVAEQNAHWNAAGGLTVMEDILQVHRDIDAVFAENDEAAFGAAEACKKSGIDPLIVGFDGIPQAIENIKNRTGAPDATVAQFPGKMAEIAMHLALAYIKYLKDVEGLIKEPLVRPVIDTGVEIIDETNVEQFKGIFGVK